MQRRSFLKAAAAAVPALGLHGRMGSAATGPAGGDLHVVGAGESVLAPRKVSHTFSAVGATPGRMLIAFSPAGKMKGYFRDAPVPHPGVSDAEFFRRYEMDCVGPSPFWKS